MIDWARVKELRDEIGQEDFDDVVEIFLEEADAAVAALTDRSDPLEQKLHFLKGSALNLGFDALAKLCQKGESLASAGVLEIDLNEIMSCYTGSRTMFLHGLSSRFAA